MKYLILYIFLITSIGVHAQIKVGTIDPNNTILQLEKYSGLKKRFDELKQVRTEELNQLEQQLAGLQEQIIQINADTESSQEEHWEKYIQAQSKYQYVEIRLFQRNREIVNELQRRESELLQPFYTAFNASIEEIALEESLNLILNPNFITDELKKKIGKDNFIDITALVVERIAEK